jgi:hypothetical protein
MGLTIYEVPNPKGHKRRPAWMRRTIVDDDTGVIFVTPAVAGVSDMAAFLAAGWDGTAAVTHEKHAYFPADWIKREYPDCADIVDRIVSRVTEWQADA